MDYYKSAEDFTKKMPYRVPPYNRRNWGHDWHSLCSYHGKLKPAIAHFLISYFTKQNDVVLDPLCGVGTIPFEAALQGRVGIGNDLSELAYCVTKAKLEKAPQTEVDNVIEELRDRINKQLPLIKYEDTPYRDFGLNRTLKEYFHPDTYREIVIARNYFTEDIANISSAKAMVFAAFLHVLHGNRPYALSRISHPLTPYAPKGEYCYKNVIEHIVSKINKSYECQSFQNYKRGKAILGDYTKLNNLDADIIITSPPFANSIRFYTQNWMRLWLCGWEPKDFKDADEKFLDQKQMKDFDIYNSFFEMCYNNLRIDGFLILHLGKTDKINMASELLLRADKHFKNIYLGSEDVKKIEKHGIKDKGITVEHQFLFLQKKRGKDIP